MKMDIKERIVKFIEKHPVPDQPLVGINFKTHGIKYFGSEKYGSIRYAWGNKEICVFNQGNKIYAQYFKTDNALNMAEISIIQMSSKVNDDNRKWKYVTRAFIYNKERVLYNEYGGQDYFNLVYSYGLREGNAKNYFQRSSSYAYVKNEFEEFVKWLGNKNQIARRYWADNILSHPYQLDLWLSYNNRKKSNGVMGSLLEESLKIPLQEINNNMFVISEPMSYCTYNQSKAFYDKGAKCIRCFFVYEDNSKLREINRIYFKDSKRIVASRNEENEWVLHGSFTENQFRYTLINFKDFVEDKNLGYIDYIKYLANNKTSVYNLCMLMQNQDLEKLVNQNMINFSKYVIKYAGFKQSSMEKYLLASNYKAKSISKKYGLNKYQLEKCEDWALSNPEHYNNPLKYLKLILLKMDISDIDNEMFDNLFNYLNIHNGDAYKLIDHLKGLSYHDRITTLKRLIKWEKLRPEAINVAYDTIMQYKRIPEERKPESSPYNINDLNELYRLHDVYVEINNEIERERREQWDIQAKKQNEQMMKMMEKNNKLRKLWEYEDDNFIIILPKQLSDITNEGADLRHCVAGYKDLHAQGRTNIMFLRKKSDPDKSFYTIEVNNGKIIQIHGYCNKWLGNNPEAIPTVMRWIKKNGFTCDSMILRSTSLGYSSAGAKLIDLPQAI